MNNYLTSSQLKSISKGQLLGNYGSAITMEILVKITAMLVVMLCSFFTDDSTLLGAAAYYLLTFLVNVLNGIFFYGQSKFYLNLVCNGQHQTTDAFSGFHLHTNRILSVRFLTLLLQLLFMIPAGISYSVYLRMDSSILLLLTSVLFVIGSAFCLYVNLTLSQVYYVMLDFPGFTTKQILDMSHNMMKGNKGRLFYIHVSLIPYYLLSALSCGLALFWIVPYRRTILTNFYLNIASA